MEQPRSPASSSTIPSPCKSRPVSPVSLPLELGEHADSPLRKRPRLDSGVEQEQTAAMPSAGSEHDRTPAPSPLPHSSEAAAHDVAQTDERDMHGSRAPLPLTPSRVTLNLRSADVSPAQNTAAQDIASNHSENLQDMTAVTASEATSYSTSSAEPMQVVVDAPSPADANPVVEIITGSDDTDPLTNMISDDGLPLETRLLEAFPLAEEYGVVESAAMIADAMNKHYLDVDLIDRVAEWIRDVWLKHASNANVALYQVFCNWSDFWIHLSSIYAKIISRKTAFSNVNKSTNPEAVFRKLENFFLPYLRLCGQLVSADLTALQDHDLQSENLPELVSPRHIRNLSFLFRPWGSTPLFKILWDCFRVPADQMQSKLALEFLATDLQGLINIVEFTKLMTSTIQLAARQHHDVDFGVIFVRFVGLFLRDCRLNHSSDELQRHHSKFNTACLELVCNLQSILLDGPLKQNGISPDMCFHLLDFAASILQDAAEADHSAAWATVRDEFGDLDNISHREGCRLGPSCLYLRICWKYLAKGRMELRVSGVQTLSTQLVSIWKDFAPAGAKADYPPFQVIVRWIVNQKLVEYLVGVDSHPQLIARSQDIVGFVMVTHHWTQEVTDAVWNSVDSSPDPRMIAEILEMLAKIVHLALPSVLLGFCDKIEHLQTISLTSAMHHFLDKLRIPLIEMLRTRKQQEEPIDPHKPVMAFIRVICDAAIQLSTLSAGGIQIVNAIHSLALSSLQQLSLSADDREGRKEIYAECFGEVRVRSRRSMGCLEAMLALLDTHEAQDLTFLLDDMDLLRGLSEDLCSYIRDSKRDTPQSAWLPALGPRLKLLTKLLSSGPTASLPHEVQETLWNHLVGQDAFSEASRDMSWNFLVSLVRSSTTADAFIDRCIHEFLPKMAPSLFAKGTFDFVQESMQYTQRISPPASPAEEVAIRVPLLDLLWRIILEAPENTIEQHAVVLLSQYHLDTPVVKKALPSSITATHTALIERCVTQLKQAAAMYPNLPAAISQNTTESQVAPTAIDASCAELYFRRTLQFVRRFVYEVRLRPAFRGSDALPPSPVSDSAALGEVKGPEITIQYQPFFETGARKEIKELKIGSENTIAELGERIRQKEGFTDFRAFHSGALFDMAKHANSLVESIHGKGLLLIRNSGSRKASSTSGKGNPHWSSVAEQALLSHFDTLYDLLDLPQRLSACLFDFLLSFPPHDRVKDLVLSSDFQLDELFPKGNKVKTLYSLRCIRDHLTRQLAAGLDCETFTLKGVQLLTSAFTESHLAPSATKPDFDNDVLALLVECLLFFLKQRPLQQPLGSCIVNHSTVAEELFILLEHLKNLSSQRVILDCSKIYACILEASFHSEEIRQAFINQKQPEDLHYWLLIGNGNASQRQEIRLSIESICTSATDSTTETPALDIVPFFWRTLANLISQAALRPMQSQEILAATKTLFLDRNAPCHDEKSLRDLIDTWTNILTTYRHCDETPQGPRDAFMFGMAKLLSHSVTYLKSFKKPLNANRLFEILFKRFLFPPTSDEVTEGSANWEPRQSPVLCADTRKEMYAVVLALCESRASYEWLMENVAGMIPGEDVEPSVWVQDISRWMRTNTGYSGLRNLTNTCYMNSLMTQLFMNSRFRRFMLGVPIVDFHSQRLLFETQKLLLQMQNSNSKYADTHAFVQAIKPYDAPEIDVSIQMDVDEFYNLLFDRWEAQMPSPDTKQLFRSLYGGQLVTQIKSKDCEHVSERLEPFMAIQCEVRGKSTLSESLQSYVEGDTMEGENKYKCESCGGKFVNAIKRSCVKDLPDNLIFHLKRFDFDLTLLDRHKINDEFAFPEQIDMRQFGVDFLNDPSSVPDPDMFELVGVLVHNGTAESGHYYSYIRLPSDNPSFSSSNWVEFNDIEVSEFDPRQIPDQCFGGNTVHGDVVFAKHHSAYMLFYQRVSTMKTDVTNSSGQHYRGPEQFSADHNLEVDIWHGNEVLSRRYCLFESTHASFLKSLVPKLRDINGGSCSSNHNIERLVCKVIINYSSRVLSRIREVPDLELTIAALLRMISNCGECSCISLSAIVENFDLAQSLILVCPIAKARSIWGMLIVDLLQNVKKMDPQAYGIDVASNDFDLSSIYDSSGNLDQTLESGMFMRTVSALRGMIPNLGRFIRSWDEYFSLWALIIDLGICELGALLSQELFLDLLTLLNLTEHKRLVSGKFQFTHELMLKYKRQTPRIGLVKAVRSFLVHVDPCSCVGQSHPINRLERFDTDLKRFPVEEPERRPLHITNSKDQLVYLNAALDGWEGADDNLLCVPAELVKELLTCAFYDTSAGSYDFTQKIANSLGSILGEYHTLYTKTCLATCLAFCRTCKFARLSLNIIDDAVTSVGTMREQKRETQRNMHGTCVDFGPQGGDNYLDFFRTLYETPEANRISGDENVPDFATHIIRRACDWAPPILLWDVKSVRIATASLLEHMIFNRYPYHLAEPPIGDDGLDVADLDLERLHANRALFEACYLNIQRAGQMRLPSSFIQSTIAVLTQCASFADKLCREETLVMQMLQTSMDRYSTQNESVPRLNIADDSRKIVQKWRETEPKLREWAYDSGDEDGISADTEWGSSFDELSDAVTDG